jgi:hypothetical protein
MPAFPRATWRAATAAALLCVVPISSLAQEAHSLSFGQIWSSGEGSLVGRPAFLLAPRLPSFLGCWQISRVPNVAPPGVTGVLPVVLVSRGITSDPRNEPWSLHASGGPVLHRLFLHALNSRFPRPCSVIQHVIQH